MIKGLQILKGKQKIKTDLFPKQLNHLRYWHQSAKQAPASLWLSNFETST